ncbi:MAG: HAD-IA family hydrolase [Solirubrobacterales bacterium]|nr:HAD-IA family hydrolase [Solirubrobacterales bacterium]
MIAAGVRAVLLDALGTLVRLDPPAPLLRVELRERFGLEVSEADAAAALAAEIAHYRAHLDEGRDLAAVAALRGRCAEVLRAALPPSDALAAVDGDALTDALLASLRFSAYADAAPALAALEQLGLRLVVVSNWDVSLHEVLERLGLAAVLHGVLTSAEIGARKPAAEIFNRALSLAEAGAHEAVHVGDSLDEDVAGARNAGITPVLVKRDGGAGPREVTTIASLGQLA